MQKVLVEVFVPASGQKHDVFLPAHLMFGDAVKLISEATADLSGGQFQGDEGTVLCNRSDGAILNINRTVSELRLHNGSQLVLI